MSAVLSAKDANAAMAVSGIQDPAAKPDIKSMEYHRQVLQNKMQQGETKQYISPSDNIMSPCTAKLNAFRNKQAGKAKTRSLFAQASAKKLEGESIFGAKPATATNGL
ncbi:hypothetical protein VTK73DRAFT_6740 [Phialemonium thermophilum]|uniref:Spo12-like protein n=1 Tax=Phialemonium thermophilum TaxID=223376 RepID=A0ABR3WIC2_9PEZI